MRRSWFRRVRLALFLSPILTAGCLCLSFGGGTTIQGPGEPFTQTGSVAVHQGQELDIYYPIPFASTPNLQVDDVMNLYEIVDQQPDHFRVRNNSKSKVLYVFGGPSLEWTARGVRGPVAPAVAPTPTTAAAPVLLQPAVQITAK